MAHFTCDCYSYEFLYMYMQILHTHTHTHVYQFNIAFIFIIIINILVHICSYMSDVVINRWHHFDDARESRMKIVSVKSIFTAKKYNI